MARFATTSLAFMFAEVPAPPWMGSTMNMSRSFPARISSQAAIIALAMRASSRPARRLVSAAAFFTRARLAIISGCIVLPVMGKFRFARSDCTP